MVRLEAEFFLFWETPVFVLKALTDSMRPSYIIGVISLILSQLIVDVGHIYKILSQQP